MIYSLVLATLVASAFAEGPAKQFYGQLNCQPITGPGETEPSKYDCSHLDGQTNDQCYHNGKLYKAGEDIPESETSPCVAHCHCKQGHSGKAEITCANVECPERLGRLKPKENCYFQYAPDKCCMTKEHCESDGEVAKCEWEGKTYKEGQTFTPTTERCMSCICTKGFDGTIKEPWCKKTSCNLFVHYGNRLRSGCIPTYYKENDCCPIPVFRCPSEADKVEGDPIATAKSDDAQCTFGEHKLSRGQKLNTDPKNKCVVCNCDVPPKVTCTMDTACYEG